LLSARFRPTEANFLRDDMTTTVGHHSKLWFRSLLRSQLSSVLNFEVIIRKCYNMVHCMVASGFIRRWIRCSWSLQSYFLRDDMKHYNSKAPFQTLIPVSF
jgi:hypothetical protein